MPPPPPKIEIASGAIYLRPIIRMHYHIEFNTSKQTTMSTTKYNIFEKPFPFIIVYKLFCH